MSNETDVSGALAKIVVLLASIVLGVVTTIHAYGLTVQSWSWLIWGQLGSLTLLAIGGAWSKK